MKSIFLICFSILWCGAKAADVTITDYGARGDGITLNTTAIQKAIDACNKSGGGKVHFPEGVYLSGTVEFKDHVVLHFQKGATLLGSTDIDDYRNLDPFTEGLGIDVGWALLVAVDRMHIGFEGEGTIDGQGSKLKAAHILRDTRPEGQRWGRRPFLLRVVRCTDVQIKDVTLKYAGAWTSHYFQSKNIRIEHLKIISVGVAHNDGIGIDGCQDVTIRNCDVVSGDDALVFKTTSSKMACKNIRATGLRLKSSQAGIKMGTESMAGFEDIYISDCVIYDTRNGGIKLLSVDGAPIRNVTISDIKMTNVRTPILLRLGSRLSVFRKGQDVQQKTGFFENVVLKNISAVSADSTQLRSATGILITGVPEYKISGISLERIRIDLPGGGSADEAAVAVPEAIDQYPEVKTFGPVIPAYGLWLRHAQDIRIKGLEIRVSKPDLRPAVFMEDVQRAQITQCAFQASGNPATIFKVKGSGNLTLQAIQTSAPARSFIEADAASKTGIVERANKTPGITRMLN